MTFAGILIMSVSVTVVTVLFGWCVYKVFTVDAQNTKKMHGFEQETPDVED